MPKSILRRMTEEERAADAKVIEALKKEFPQGQFGRKPSPPGIPSKIRQARESRGLTWYAVAKAADIANPATIRDIEQGKDVKLSSLEAVAKALHLELDLVEAAAH